MTVLDLSPSSSSLFLLQVCRHLHAYSSKIVLIAPQVGCPPLMHSPAAMVSLSSVSVSGGDRRQSCVVLETLLRFLLWGFPQDIGCYFAAVGSL